MTSTQSDPVSFLSYFQLITVNESIYCQHSVEPPTNALLSFYKAVGIILGPLNAILNGLCVHVFKHPAWKQSAMSRILKGLSIVELCMGICLFVFALLYAHSSQTGSRADTTSTLFSFNSTSAPDTNQLLNLNEAATRRTRDRTFFLTVASFLSMTIFSRCLVAFQVARNWSVVLLAAYRYDRICRPIGTGTAFPRERIPIILMAIISLSFVVALPRVFEMGIVICDVSGLYAEDTILFSGNAIYQIAYLGVVMFVVQSGGPIICVCVLSAFVIRLIAKRRKIHQMNEQKSARRLLSMQQYARASQIESGKSVPILTDNARSEMEHSTNGVSESMVVNYNTNGNNNLNNDGESQAPENQGEEDGTRPKSVPNIRLNNSSPTDNMPNTLTFVTPVERPSPTGDKLIFALCITFFVLETPAFFSKILNPYLEQHYREFDLWLSVIANVLVYLDSTLNAFVYTASNPTFRKVAYDEFIKYRNRLTGTSNRPSNSVGYAQSLSVRFSRAA